AKTFRRHSHLPPPACPRLERRLSVALGRPSCRSTIAGGQAISSNQGETGENPAPIYRSTKEDPPEATGAWVRPVACRGDCLSGGPFPEDEKTKRKRAVWRQRIALTITWPVYSVQVVKSDTGFMSGRATLYNATAVTRAPPTAVE